MADPPVVRFGAGSIDPIPLADSSYGLLWGDFVEDEPGELGGGLVEVKDARGVDDQMATPALFDAQVDAEARAV